MIWGQKAIFARNRSVGGSVMSARGRTFKRISNKAAQGSSTTIPNDDEKKTKEFPQIKVPLHKSGDTP